MRAALLLPITAATAFGYIAIAQTPSATVVAAGSEQAIRIGKMSVSRPFGAELVDRLVLAGSYRLRGRRVHLVRGDAGAACPSRFVFISEQPGSAPLASTPFGTCSGNIRVSASPSALVVAMPAAPAGGPTVRFSFDGGAVRALDRVVAQPDVVAGTACIPAARATATTQADAIATFERDFPLEYRRSGTLKKIDIDPQEMRDMVAALACLSLWPAAEQRLPAVVTPLFASRHGPAAFAALENISQGPGSNPHLRAAARSFAAEMRFRVERRERL